MFLLHFKNIINILNFNNKNITNLIFLKKQLINKIYVLNLLKKKKKVKQISSSLKFCKSSENLVNYIIGISLSNTNINIYLTDIKGKIKYFASAGVLGLNGKQKIKKPGVIIKLLRILISRLKHKTEIYIALHLKNFNKFYVSFILSLLKKYLKIELVRIFNNKPYNGCRPKKLKRKKRKRMFFK